LHAGDRIAVGHEYDNNLNIFKSIPTTVPWFSTCQSLLVLDEVIPEVTMGIADQRGVLELGGCGSGGG